MPRYLVYVDAVDMAVIDEAFGNTLDRGFVEEYVTLTENGKPIVFDERMVSNPEWCNKVANLCVGLTEN
jgi:hypothetical protein